MFIDPKFLIGLKFASPIDSNIEYTAIGYGQNETFLIIATTFDSTNGKSSIKTFKLSDVKLRGNVAP
jgi:hypothetical protein